MASQNARRGMTAVGVLLLLAALVVTQDWALRRRARFPAAEDVLYLPQPSALHAMSLGHDELAADLVFIRGLVYFGTQLEQQGEYRWLENYLDTITKLDPRWKTPFRWAGTATMYNGRPITNAAVMLSNHFLERGVQQFPDDWELPFMLGCNYLFEMKTDDPKQREEWRRIGGEWIRHAAIVGGAPAWVPLLAATIMRQEGRDEAAMRHLEEVYVSTQDERTRGAGAQPASCRCTPRSIWRARSASAPPSRRRGRRRCPTRRPICSSPSARRDRREWTSRRSARSPASVTRARRLRRFADARQDGAPLGRILLRQRFARGGGGFVVAAERFEARARSASRWPGRRPTAAWRPRGAPAPRRARARAGARCRGSTAPARRRAATSTAWRHSVSSSRQTRASRGTATA